MMMTEIDIQQTHNKLTCIHHLPAEEIEQLQRKSESLESDWSQLNGEGEL